MPLRMPHLPSIKTMRGLEQHLASMSIGGRATRFLSPIGDNLA